MVVVDSSALIPLSWVGRLDLIDETFDEIRAVEGVREEVLSGGERGTAVLKSFLDDAEVIAAPDRADEVASLEGIAVTDAAVVLAAADGEEILLANDKGLIEVGRSHGVECWWVTTLLLKCTKEGIVSSEEATDLLYDLVDEGMNLSPQIYLSIARESQRLRRA
jgi:predicted nucleic acid-binding protein